MADLDLRRCIFIVLLGAVFVAAGCDFVIALGRRAPGFVSFPRQGPILTWRHVRAERDACPRLDQMGLTLGDIELF